MEDPQCSNEDYEECLSKIQFHEGKHKLEQTYVYEKEIGKGGYGYVMCGYRKLDHCSVAIKVIPSMLVSEWYESKILKRKIPLEVLLLSLTRNINGVVPIEEYYEDTKLKEWYIVMKRYMKTKDLFEYITKEQYLEEDIACNILYQLMIIIIDCHLHGVVHRDVKEENILIDTSSYKIWLIDFGSGCLMRDDHHITYNGTLAYSPPEWLRHGEYRGCQLDSWTLGIVLYSMLCGCVPFEDEEQILSGVVRFPRKLSQSCIDLILRCLQSEPELRIQPFEMISHPWVTSNRNQCDSGRGSFDDAFNEAPMSRKCSCSCGDNVLYQEDDNTAVAAIETTEYNEDCIRQIDPEWQFKVIERSLSLDIERKQYLMSLKNLDETLTNGNNYKSMSDVNSKICFSTLLLDKLSTIQRVNDNGYEEDIDDNFDEDI